MDLSKGWKDYLIYIFLLPTVKEYDLLVANGLYIHQVHYEGSDATTMTSDLFETVSGIDFHYE